MAEIHVNDVRIKGSYFTLNPAACEHGADFMVVLDLLWAVGDYATDINPNVEDPLIPLTFPHDVLDSEQVEDFLEQHLITEDKQADTFSLTEKMISILTDAADLQNKLANETFHGCPYHLY